MSPIQIPSLRRLQIVHLDDDGAWVLFDDFIALLKENHSKDDKISEIRKDNILSRFRKWEQVPLRTTPDNKRHIQLSAVLQHIFYCADSLDFCSKVVKEVTQYITKGPENGARKKREGSTAQWAGAVKSEPREQGNGGNSGEKQTETCGVASSPAFSISSERGILHLYQKIATTSIHKPMVESVLLNGPSMECYKLRTLESRLKESFDPKGWESIKVFEWHFQHTLKGISNDQISSVEILDKKWKYWEECTACANSEKFLATICSTVARIDRKREDTREGALQESPPQLIHGQKTHLPSLLHSSIVVNALGMRASSFQIVYTDCHDAICHHTEGIHVFLEVSPFASIDAAYALDVVHSIKSEMVHSHGEICREVTVFTSGTFSAFRNEGEVQILRLREAALLGHLDQYKFVTEREEDIVMECEDQGCPTCGEAVEQSQPFDWKSLDILFEWKYSVPLYFQIFLEMFLNKRSLKHSTNAEKYVRSKLLRLFQSFHLLLNVRNRHHTTVLHGLYSSKILGTPLEELFGRKRRKKQRNALQR